MTRRGTLYLLIVVAFLAIATFALAQKKENPAAHAGHNLQTTLEALERAGWEAYKNRDKAAFTALATEDYAAGIANGQGMHDLKATLASMDQVTIESYTLRDFKLKTLGPRTALLTYHATMRYKIGTGAVQESKMYASDLWVKRAGEWKSLHYQETEIK